MLFGLLLLLRERREKEDDFYFDMIRSVDICGVSRSVRRVLLAVLSLLSHFCCDGIRLSPTQVCVSVRVRVP